MLRYEALSSLDKPEKEKLFDDHIDRLIKKKKASIPSLLWYRDILYTNNLYK
jgi:hypothetical protein